MNWIFFLYTTTFSCLRWTTPTLCKHIYLPGLNKTNVLLWKSGITLWLMLLKIECKYLHASCFYSNNVSLYLGYDTNAPVCVTHFSIRNKWQWLVRFLAPFFSSLGRGILITVGAGIESNQLRRVTDVLHSCGAPRCAGRSAECHRVSNLPVRCGESRGGDMKDGLSDGIH